MFLNLKSLKKKLFGMSTGKTRSNMKIFIFLAWILVIGYLLITAPMGDKNSHIFETNCHNCKTLK